ncbi:DUF3520 domain-containing protein [Neolewinella aurantiaca]|uniref:DUF3520 domain-containing protein n=2 Tax=Neolewinella aurantiaca TaxID=2602767 RepID=A0A5C7F3L5_9BACT|nr:DUF3520 domain-containing protein [Neolewinella aurantiaca]
MTTDLDGKFLACGLPKRKQVDLQIDYTGCATLKVVGVLVGDKSVELEIERGGVLLEEIVVKEFKKPLIEQDNTTSGQRMTSEDVRNLPKRNVSQISGIAAGASPAPANRMASMRGSRANAKQYYVDGVSVGATAGSQMPSPDPEVNEQYNGIAENGFKSTKEEQISTISTDVDRAAYANVRRFLNSGQLPPADAVRSEEMINYFKYEDPNPETKDDVALRTEFMTCPWNPQNQLLRVSAKTMPIATADIPASNLVFLLDVSGSMSSTNKLPLVKESLKLLTQSLRQEDKVSIVVYAGAAGLVLPATSDPGAIIAALDELNSGGSTAGGAGIELAYKTAAENFIEGGNNRIILATDGDFNVGVRNQDALVKLIEQKRETGIYLTVLGFGTGNYQEGTMQLLADKGNGNHGYIDSPAEARKVLVEEFGGTLYTVAKDVKLQLEFNEKAIASYRLIGYENRLLNTEDFDDDTKDAAEMGAGHSVTVLYELIPARGFKKADAMADLRLRFKPNTGGPSQKISEPVATDYTPEEMISNDLLWSAAVAEFAMLLRGSEHKGEATWTHCLEMAKKAQGEDANGYRAEMIGLIKTAQEIDGEARR